MKLTIKRVLAFAVIAVMLILAVSAETIPHVTLSIDDGAEAGVYDVTVNVKSEGGRIDAFQVIVTFNNNLLMPVDAENFTKVDLSTVTYEPVLLAASGRNAYDFPVDPTWETVDDKTTVTIDGYTTKGDKFNAADLDIMTISFALAEGKTTKDIKADDFVVKTLFVSDGINGQFGFNRASVSKALTYTNNVPNSDSDVLTISVKKDDIVYFQDDSVAKITEDNDKYVLPSTKDGYVVVNTGFTAQKLYKVESGKITEVTSNENGVLATDSASLRKDSTATGLRFKTSFLTSLKDSVKEYGVLVTVESKNNDLPKNYVLNMALVNAGKAKKGVAFNKANGTDIYYDVDGARTIVTAVATGIPITKDAVTTNIAARPYYELEDGTIIYGETVKRQAAEVAQKIKNEDAETYAKYKDYIDQIIALVAEDPTYATIDLGPLFS